MKLFEFEYREYSEPYYVVADSMSKAIEILEATAQRGGIISVIRLCSEKIFTQDNIGINVKPAKDRG